MGLRIWSVLRHACVMVVRRLKTYAFLSVTIILSLSFLLGFLLLTDSQLYNEYKKLFNRRRGDVFMNESLYDGPDTDKQKMLYENLDKMENTVYFTGYMGWLGDMSIYYDSVPMGMDEGMNPHLQNLMAWFLPDGAWLDLTDIFYFPVDNEIVWIDERGDEAFQLNADEVILSEQVYRLLRLDEESEPSFQLRTNIGINTQLKVVGYTRGVTQVDYHSINTWYQTPGMILSVKFLDWLDQSGWELYGEDGILSYRIYYVHTDSPERVTTLARMLSYSGIYSVYEAQDEALEQIRTQKSTKSIIACALLVLLGINLYSSFSNALNERKFEIGVKRAIGASAWSIVRQFLYESMLVMLANVAISVVLVVDVAVIYKFIVQWQSQLLDTYVLYITPHSIAIFGLCAVTLTVVFSLIFAYKSTQVEIVQYLKAE